MFTNNRFRIVHGDSVPLGDYAVSSELPRGTMMELADDNRDPGDEVIDACTNGAHVPLGFLARNTDDEGVTMEDVILERKDTKVKIGDKVSIFTLPPNSIIEVECEDAIAYNAAQPADTADGYLLVTSGTGHLGADDVRETPLGCKNGRWYKAQSGDYVCGHLHSAVLTPVIKSTNLRVQIKIVNGYIKS